MMEHRGILCASLCFFTAVFASPFQESTPANLSLPNETATVPVEVNQWTSNRVEITCDASKPFTDAVVMDCRSAKNRFGVGSKVLTWLDRPTQLARDFINLPYRIVGGVSGYLLLQGHRTDNRSQMKVVVTFNRSSCHQPHLDGRVSTTWGKQSPACSPNVHWDSLPEG